MRTIYMLCGNTGAGKTTYAHQLAAEQSAVRFSIDPWMAMHFGPDYTGQGLDWMLPRTERCKRQMWDIIGQLVRLNMDVVLDIGFGSVASRDQCRAQARALGAEVCLHYLSVPREVRWRRVHARNLKKDPKVYALEVSEAMFDYVDALFEPPTEEEMLRGMLIEM